MMKEMEKEIKEMDPEAKELLKQMGVGMPDKKKLECAVTGDYTDVGPIPKQDAARIQKARQTKLNSGNLADYIRSVHQAVSSKAGQGAVQTGKKIFRSAKSSGAELRQPNCYNTAKKGGAGS